MHTATHTRPALGSTSAPAAPVPRLPLLAARLSTVRALASSSRHDLSCPYRTLGLEPGVADEAQIKKAYRRLAKKFHPDVAQQQQQQHSQPGGAAQPATNVQFLAISEAYGFIMEQLRNGGTGAGGTQGRAGNSAAFHDWFWTFRQRRTWRRHQQQQQQQQQQQRHAGASGHHQAPNLEEDMVAEDPSGCSDSAPPPSGGAGSSWGGGGGFVLTQNLTPQSAEGLRSQLAGLRHRAAIRKNRPAPAPASSPTADATATASGISSDPTATEEEAHPAYRPGAGPASWFAAAAGPSDSADPPLPVAEPGAAEAQVGGSDAARGCTSEGAGQRAAEQQGPARRAFASAAGARREALREQLHGMRRVAALREQMYGDA